MAQKIYSISDEIKNAIYGLKSLKIIEDKTIQGDIVTILEGGRDALTKRMQKLNIK
jgi:hypothetical protein